MLTFHVHVMCYVIMSIQAFSFIQTISFHYINTNTINNDNGIYVCDRFDCILEQYWFI